MALRDHWHAFRFTLHAVRTNRRPRPPVVPPPMSLSPTPLDSPLRQAERALRKPSSAIWLRSVCVRTARFDEALAFYVNTLGLTLGSVGVHPLTTRARAQMLDAEGHEVLELVETDDPSARGVHELAFGMPRRTVTLLRARLEAQAVEYAAASDTLYFKDVDGTALRIEAL